MTQSLLKSFRRSSSIFVALVMLMRFGSVQPPAAVAGPVLEDSAIAYGYFYPHPTAPGFGSGDSNAAALGDVDGDGDLDAVLAKTSAEEVWLNDGTGVYTPHPSAPTFGDADSRELALADIDGDDDLDALIANYDAADSLWRNDGDGIFTFAAALGLGAATDVKLADLDGDGDPDAVFANDQDQPETVWLNTGGQLTLAGAYGTGYSRAVELADVNGDGKIDFVVANHNNQAETIWLGDGLGGFAAGGSFGQRDGSNESNTNDLVLFDHEQDGDLDLLKVDVGYYSYWTIWLNNGGVFSRVSNYYFNLPSTDISQADLDNNGSLDLVIASLSEDRGITLMDRLGPQIVNIYMTIDSGMSTGVEAGDLDGDGDQDMLVSTLGSAGPPETVWRNEKPRCVHAEHFSYRNPNLFTPSEAIFAANAPAADGEGGFYPHPAVSEIGTGSSMDFSMGDVDGDGDLDLVTAEDHAPERVLLNDGSGVFQEARVFGGGDTCGIVLGDLDSDGDLDAITVDFLEAITIWLNDGAGVFTDYATLDVQSSSAGVTLGDVDGDGDLDAVFNTLMHDPELIFLNDGSGNLTSFPSGSLPNNRTMTTEIVLGDLDGDNDLDLIRADHHFEPTFYRNRGSGIFDEFPGIYYRDLRNGSDFGLGDFDGDGDNDLAACQRSPGWDTGIVFVNDGTGVFTLSGPERSDLYPCNTVSIGDLDGDADLDILLAGDMNTLIEANDGSAIVSPFGELAVRKAIQSDLGDLDADGDLDAVLLTTDGAPSVWLNGPSVAITAIERLDPNPTSAASVRFGVHFNLPVEGVTRNAFYASGSSLRDLVVTEVSGTGADYTVTVSIGVGKGVLSLHLINTIGVTGPQGQGLSHIPFTAETYTVVDPTPPTVTIDQAAGQLDPTSVQPVVFTAVFSEAPTGFTAADVALSGSAGATTAVITRIPPWESWIYRIEVSGMSASGSVIASIPEGAFTDYAGNANLASTSTDNTVEFVVYLPPAAVADSAATNEDVPVGIQVLSNDSDPNSSALAIHSVTDPAHGVAAIDDNGSPEVSGDDFVRYTPDPNYHGADSFTYTVRNQLGQSAIADVQVEVQPVNDAPSIVPGSDVVVELNSGEFSELWAWGISAGPADEAGQALTFEVIGNTNPALFSPQPSVTPAGRLDFTPAEGAFGRTEITIRLRDSGGTQNGGTDVSPEYTFTIQIGPDWPLYLPIIQ